ncbi:bifunctional diguanylate cyclase/phosphodiesterase [Peribacillus glennii]|uniref:Bifunctional diguanylate cyclase/phosphodiesterase n=1 Tax=Peribacillus glennii TaxID=2303991 RepID=A0A372L7N2_9BACI|nr:bifunctional diguanylate cyclase/phosphodiesterase [Peribacillus glennii]RFU60763.1 bifunctional diguanylate cyclase/phosphodiesterase [Peribacillus glennii]
METYSGTYHLSLVLLSIIIAIIASYSALSLSIQINKATGFLRYLWLWVGAFAMGMGIWSMHFIAMLAFHLSIPVSYNRTIVLISIFPAIISSGLAFFIISRPTMGKMQVILGALFMTTGIVSMHYTGMAAMEMGAMIEYDPLFWVLSAIIAFIASLVALYLLFFIGRNQNIPYLRLRKAGSALIMGIAISGMHYMGMSAAKFKVGHHSNSSVSLIDSTLLAYCIGIGMLIIFSLVFLSIYVEKKFESQSIKLESKFRSVIESTTDAIILADSQGDIISWNKGAEIMFGYEEQEVLGKNLQLIIPENFRETHEKGMKRYLSAQEARVIGKTVELQGLRKGGYVFPIELSIATWKEEGKIFFSSIIRDITERKQSEEKMNRMVYRDPLTNLPNRLLLIDRLNTALDQANQNKQSLGVMFIDLDRFKYINDSLGHATGDGLLIEVAKRIQACAGKSDTVSRQGGDEFIVLISQSTSDTLTKIAKRIVERISQPFVINGHELFVTPSIGISVYPTDGKYAETLIKNADTAMYRVKEQGKNDFGFYAPEMDEEISKKMTLEIGLRKALQNNEFTVLYQPQINIDTGKLIGVEALTRWIHPEWGTISPAEFIPLAEETGLILPIGEWVLYEACAQNKAWQNEGHSPVRMAVNISSRQFQQLNFVDTVRDILQKTGLAPMYLELELTESIIQDSLHAISTMHTLKEMGVHLSIDDFGTGYSSLSYLKTFPIDTLKIDQAFTRNIFIDQKDASLVSTIINMAHNLELKVIAEGVETSEQLHFLQQKRCNEAQGYFFSRPIPAEEMNSFFQQQMIANP